MTTLTLVRHGQASFGASNYDQLSPLGERQGELLGEHWQRCAIGFDAVFSGTLQRQRITAERALPALVGGIALHCDPAFDEYDHVGMIRAYLPLIAREHPELATRTADVVSSPALFRTFFNLVIDAWMADRPAEGPLAETWTGFRRRCLDGMLTAAGAGERVAVFTSGGVIAATMQRALGIHDDVARQLNWRIFNASTHVFSVGPKGLHLMGFNDVSHLQALRDDSLLTRL